MEKNLNLSLQYYLKTSIRKDKPINVYVKPLLQSEIANTFYSDRFLPVYKAHNNFLRTTQGWIQESCMKESQKVFPTNITDIGVWIIAQFLPRSNKNRTCSYQSPKSIVCELNCHYGGSAYSQIALTELLRANQTTFSCHYTVSADLIIQHIPDYEEAYIDPFKHHDGLEKNTIFMKIFDADGRKARAVGDSLCRLLQTWYGPLNIIEVESSF